MIPEVRKDKEGNITIETKLNKEIMNRKWARKVWETAIENQDYSIRMLVKGEEYNLADRKDIFRVYQSQANRGLLIISGKENADITGLVMYYLFNPEGGDENEA